jgi:hypothetical protein
MNMCAIHMFMCATYMFIRATYMFMCATYMFIRATYMFVCATHTFIRATYMFMCATYMFVCATHMFMCTAKIQEMPGPLRGMLQSPVMAAVCPDNHSGGTEPHSLLIMSDAACPDAFYGVMQSPVTSRRASR